MCIRDSLETMTMQKAGRMPQIALKNLFWKDSMMISLNASGVLSMTLHLTRLYLQSGTSGFSPLKTQKLSGQWKLLRENLSVPPEELPDIFTTAIMAI